MKSRRERDAIFVFPFLSLKDKWEPSLPAPNKTVSSRLKVGTHEGLVPQRLVPGTSPGDQVPSSEIPILVKKCSRRD